MRLIIHFARFGPYHRARLRAVAEELAPFGWEVIGLETASTDATYDWRTEPTAKENGDGARVVTVFPGRVYEEIRAGECRRGLVESLDAMAPDAIAVPGWGTLDARVSLAWSRRKDVRALIMSETREVDGERRWWKERIKSWIMRHVAGAIVGGASHRDYLAKLGIAPDRIVTGYNVVDNAYFASEAARWRAAEAGGRLAEGGGPSWGPMFLASNRFVGRKNLDRLLAAYALYCQSFTTDRQPLSADRPWSLCLLGDGPLRQRLIAQCHELGLTVIEAAPWEIEECPPPAANGNTVYFPGFRQIEELPRFYASAAAFIHPAFEEPWGLVINEAMAAGLPVLSGDNVGAAEELIEEGKSGWTFDATDLGAMAAAMARLATLSEADRLAMGARAAARLEECCPTRAFGSGIRRLLTGGA